ncbi:MAG: CPBP family intramembrane metalloprotease [Flavobacteriales bacterium]|nr:CPBP family intramembrane metalloprotease [Flavobacteriales bacterium]
MRRIFSSLWVLGLGTLVIFPLLAWPVLYFSDTSFWSIFEVSYEDLFSIPTFLSAGIIFGLMVIWMSELSYFEDSLARYRNILKDVRINRFSAFFLSVCAGFGEEIFFRGALQPLLGVIITAVLFVGIHGYFSIKNWKVNVFSISLTLFIMLLGWASREFSIWHAIAGHFSYDLVLLMYHARQSR